MRTFLLSLVVALVGLGIVERADAQRGRGGFNVGYQGSGWGVGYNSWGGGYGYVGQPGWRGSNFGNYGYGNYGYGTRGYGNYGYGNYGYGARGYGFNNYGRGYNPWFSYYNFPGYRSTYTSYPYDSYVYTYPDSGYSVQPSTAPQALRNNESVVLVMLPDPQAEVFIDGQPTKQTGYERVFHTPTLEPGNTYSYSISAAFERDGKRVQEQRTVQVTPGQPSFVDFTKVMPPAAK